MNKTTQLQQACVMLSVLDLTDKLPDELAKTQH